MPQNQVDKRFLVGLGVPIYRAIVDINTYYLDQYLGKFRSEAEYSVAPLFQNLGEAISKVNQNYSINLNYYTLYGDYGTTVEVETVDENNHRLRTFSYLRSDSDKIVECFGLLEPEDIAQIRRDTEETADRTKKYKIYPLVLSKYLKNPRNLITLNPEMRGYVNTALNLYFRASDAFFQEDNYLYFLMCTLFAALSAENRMWLVYEKLTRGNPEIKTLGRMIEKSYKVDRKRRKKLFTQRFKSELLALNNVRIKTVHPSMHRLHFPDDAVNALVCLGELLVRCHDYGF